jgi:TctA family transporter
MPEQRNSSDILFYLTAVVCGLLSGITHITIEDPLLTSLVVLISTMFLGFMRPEKPWRWLLIVGLLVPVVMLTANALHYYRTLTRAGLAGSILIMLPGVAGAYGGHFGRKFIGVMFQGKQE